MRRLLLAFALTVASSAQAETLVPIGDGDSGRIAIDIESVESNNEAIGAKFAMFSDGMRVNFYLMRERGCELPTGTLLVTQLPLGPDPSKQASQLL